MKILSLSRPLFIFVLFSFYVLISGCSKKGSDSTTPAVTVAAGTMTCKLDGKAYTFPTTTFTRTKSSSSDVSLDIEASDDKSSESVRLNISAYAGAKSYTIDLADNEAEAEINNKFYLAFSASGNAGTIVITKESSTNIEGTFSFTALDPASSSIKTVKFTEGQFNAKVQ
jgi:hypothetical protein